MVMELFIHLVVQCVEVLRIGIERINGRFRLVLRKVHGGLVYVEKKGSFPSKIIHIKYIL